MNSIPENYYNYSDDSDDEIDIQIKNAKHNIEITKNIIIDNIDKVINRGENIENLIDETEDLNQSSLKFNKTVKKVKCKICCENMKFKLIFCILFVIVIYCILVFVCGGLDFKKCM